MSRKSAGHFALCALAACSSLIAYADPETELREAVTTLSRTSYAWETTVRQRFSGETNEPRLNPNAALEVQGAMDPNSYMEVTLQPARDALAVPVTAYSRTGDAVALTPLGWLRRTEMRNVPQPDKTVDFQGKPVRLSRALTIALRVTSVRPLTEELFDLLPDIKSCRSESGLIIAELRDAAVEKLWGSATAKRAPEISGTVIFKLSDGALNECHFALGIGFPNDRTKKIAWSMLQWSTHIKGVGTTTVEPPTEAVKKLEE